MAGPCSIEDEDHIIETAHAVKAPRAPILLREGFRAAKLAVRVPWAGGGGAALPQTCRRETGMPVITELMSVRDIDDVAEYADIVQIGARNMQNFMLLDEVGQPGKPVMLKRALSGQIEEWLLAAEYILAQGTPT